MNHVTHISRLSLAALLGILVYTVDAAGQPPGEQRPVRAPDINDAARRGDLDAVKRHLADYKDISQFGEGFDGPLHIAAAAGHDAIVEHLLKAGMNVNIKGTNRFTSLHLAKNAKVAKVLLKSGASVDQLNCFSLTPLQSAASDKRLDVVEAILSHGHKLDLWTAVMLGKREDVVRLIKADPKAVKPQGTVVRKPMLSVAAHAGNLELVRLLLEAGADVNELTPCLTSCGVPVLSHAVCGKNLEVVAELVRKGARVKGEWLEAHDPLNCAKELGLNDIAELLEKTAKLQAIERKK